MNRLITINDFAIRSSAKGVLLFPESLLPDDMSMDDIAEQWTKSDGLIAYKPKPGVEAPKQIVNNLTNIGTHEMLQLMMNLMEDTSGVTGALQGKPGFSGTRRLCMHSSNKTHPRPYLTYWKHSAPL